MKLSEQLASKEALPYHETGQARTLAFKNGWDACRDHFISILTENMNAGLTLADGQRPAKDVLMETYRDLLSIAHNQ